MWEFKSWKDSNPLGKRAENFLKENIIWAIYLRRDLRFKCPKHWDEKTNSPITTEEYCPDCLGLGLKTEATLVPCRAYYPSKSIRLNTRETDYRTEAGYIEFYPFVIDFPRHVSPKLEDVVLFAEWKQYHQTLAKTTRTPVGVTGSYLIKAAYSNIEREVGWHTVGCEPLPLSDQWSNNLLPHLRNLPVDINNSQWLT